MFKLYAKGTGASVGTKGGKNTSVGSKATGVVSKVKAGVSNAIGTAKRFIKGNARGNK